MVCDGRSGLFSVPEGGVDKGADRACGWSRKFKSRDGLLLFFVSCFFFFLGGGGALVLGKQAVRIWK